MEEKRWTVERWMGRSQKNNEFLDMLRQIWDAKPVDKFQSVIEKGYQKDEKFVFLKNLPGKSFLNWNNGIKLELDYPVLSKQLLTATFKAETFMKC